LQSLKSGQIVEIGILGQVPLNTYMISDSKNCLIATIRRLAIRAAKFLLLSRRFRRSVGEFPTIECFR
jgi:hypothetical protein